MFALRGAVSRRRLQQRLAASEEALTDARAHFLVFAENARDVLWSYEPDSRRLLFVSSSASRLTGRSPEALQQLIDEKRFGEIFEPGFAAEYIRIETAIRRQLEAHPQLCEWSECLECLLIHRDGRRIPVETTILVSRPPDGRPWRLDGISRDVTERKRAEDILQRKRVLQEIYEILADAPTGFPAMADTLGRKLARLLGEVEVHVRVQQAPAVDVDILCSDHESRRSPSPCLGPCRIARTIERAEVVYSPRELRPIACPLMPGNDTASVMVTSIRTRAGVVVGQVCVAGRSDRSWSANEARIIDIFAAVLALEAERWSMDRHLALMDRIRYSGKLAAGLAHEVRNPLQAIMLIAETLGEGDGTPDQLAQQMTYVRDQVIRLSQTMQHLVVLGRPWRSETVELLDVRDLILRAELRWRSGTPGSEQISLEAPVWLNEELPLVEGDSVSLEQAFAHLFDNAALHGAARRIRIALDAAFGGAWSILIEDDGAGMAPEVRLRACEPFFSTMPRGLGLGLTVARHVFELHGGSMRISAAVVGTGTRVEVLLPQAVAS